MKTLAAAFSAVWAETKKIASAVAGVATKDGQIIETATANGGAVVSALVPAAAPVVTELDGLEVAMMGKVAAYAQDVANAPTLEALFAEIWPGIKTAIGVMQNHPTVQSVTAALNAPPAV